MSTWRFDDWSGRQYDDPAIGLVQPGDVREADEAPDNQHWTLVDDVAVSENPDTDTKSEDVDKSGQVNTNVDSAQASTNDDTAQATENEGAPSSDATDTAKGDA